jgi:LacI family transcriptional regulator
VSVSTAFLRQSIASAFHGIYFSTESVMSVTIYEIAERAGVSSSTVARVLRGDVKESSQGSATRAAHIRRLAKEMGYRRNWRARAFSRCRTHAVGLFHTHSAWICEGTMGEVAGGFTDAMHDQGYHVVVVPYDNKGHWRELLRDRRFDGIAISHILPEDAIQVISEIGLPRVLLMDKSVPDWSCAVTEDEAGAYTATKHLLGLGHRRIVMYLHDSIRQHFSVADRHAGYTRAMVEAGLESEMRFIHASEAELPDLLVHDPNRPTAVVCYCHVEAMAVYLTAWQHGLRIPNDLSVVAFNDLQSTKYMTPPLTTMGFATRHIGRLGADLLVKQIESDEAEVERVFVRQTLIQRASTAPPAVRGMIADVEPLNVTGRAG